MQSLEENMHAMKLFDFVLARDRNVELLAIERPKTDLSISGVARWAT